MTIYTCLWEAWSALALETWQVVVVVSWGLIPIVCLVWVGHVLKAAGTAIPSEFFKEEASDPPRFHHRPYLEWERPNGSRRTITISKPPCFRHSRKTSANRNHAPKAKRSRRRNER